MLSYIVNLQKKTWFHFNENSLFFLSLNVASSSVNFKSQMIAEQWAGMCSGGVFLYSFREK